jgi:AcrR family transcriptional regulator
MPVANAQIANADAARRIMDACERILCEVESFDDATVRRIARLADTSASAVSYYFGSQERLVIAVARRVYRRLNIERLALLERASLKRAPEPPDLDDIIAALVGPSVRWSLDPTSSYPVLVHVTQTAERSRDPDLYRQIAEDIDHHRAFIPPLKRHAPWLSEADIGWRLSCALGIRSQIIRSRARTEALTNHSIDLDDANEVIGRIVEVVAPMFRRTA